MTEERIIRSVLVAAALVLGVAGCPDVPPDDNDAGVGGSATGGTGGGATGGSDAAGMANAGRAGAPGPCAEILLDNGGPPANYPPTYVDTAEAAARFEAEKARLIATYGIAESDYELRPTDITRSATMQQTGNRLLLGDDALGTSASPAAEGFLSRWPVLFNVPALPLVATGTVCGLTVCRYEFAQDYCGLAVAASQAEYGGTAQVFIDPATGGLLKTVSSLVPMVPVPRNVLLTEEQIRARLVGTSVSWACKDGTHSDVITADAPVTFPDAPSIYVLPSLIGEAALEYRLAVGLSVTVGMGPWTAYVDGIDGTVLGVTAGFICD